MKFNLDKLKVQLKLVGPRMDLVHKKKISLNLSAKNEIASLLEKGKINTARIKVFKNKNLILLLMSRKIINLLIYI